MAGILYFSTCYFRPQKRKLQRR